MVQHGCMRKQKLAFTKEDDKTLEQFREAVHNLTADPGLFLKLNKAIVAEDVRAYQEILHKLEFPPIICHMVCWWVHSVRCYIVWVRRCKIFCHSILQKS